MNVLCYVSLAMSAFGLVIAGLGDKSLFTPCSILWGSTLIAIAILSHRSKKEADQPVTTKHLDDIL